MYGVAMTFLELNGKQEVIIFLIAVVSIPSLKAFFHFPSKNESILADIQLKFILWAVSISMWYFKLKDCFQTVIWILAGFWIFLRIFFWASS